jgi:hypothetical protein
LPSHFSRWSIEDHFDWTHEITLLCQMYFLGSASNDCLQFIEQKK